MTASSIVWDSLREVFSKRSLIILMQIRRDINAEQTY